MKHQYKSRWSRIIFLCLCLSVIEQGWVRKTYSCEFIAGIIGHELLYAATMLAGALVSRAWNNAPYSSADHAFQQDISRLAYKAVTPSSPSSRQKPEPSSVVHTPAYVHREPIIPEVVHKTANVIDTARAVAVHVAKEQDKPNVVSAVTTQELVHAVSVDWHRQVEQSCQESLRKAQLYEQYSLQTKIQQWSQDQAWTREMHANGGVTCHAPNPIFSIYLGPSRRQHTPSLADDIVERRAQERIQLACDPELRAAVTQEFCAFLRNDYCLLYGSLLERIAALLYLADFHIDVVAFGQPLNAIQKEIYAEYACKDGIICIDRLADMTDAHAIVKKHIAFQKKLASHFEKPCRPVCGVCQNKGKQCEHLRQLRKNSQLIKNKKNVSLNAIRNNPTNQCYRNMLSAFAAGNMQQVEQIKNDNSSIPGVQILYEQIRIAYNKMIEHQEALLKDGYGILHFQLPAPLWDPLYTALSTKDREHLKNNPAALASFNDVLLMRSRYKNALHKAWKISQEAIPVVHQALYAFIDCGTIPERIEKIHELTSNPALSKCEQKELVEALFLPNGIIKDFSEYERTQTLQVPRAILQPEHSETCKLLNQLVYAERTCGDEQDQIRLENAIASLHYAVIADHDAEPYISYAQDVYKQTIAATMLFNAQHQGSNNQLPSGPGGQPNKNKKNGKPPENKNGPRLQTMTEEQWEKSLKYCSQDNNLRHWFRKNAVRHKFVELLVKMNNDEIALVQALLAGSIGKLPQEGFFEDIPIEVEGFIVSVQGIVTEGIIKFGTIFIK